MNAKTGQEIWHELPGRAVLGIDFASQAKGGAALWPCWSLGILVSRFPLISRREKRK